MKTMWNLAGVAMVAMFVSACGGETDAGVDPNPPTQDAGSAIGAAGAQGPAGVAGPKGDQGPAGPQGVAGQAGPQGSEGPKGDIGPVGAAGPQGLIGPQGVEGAQGLAGAAGPKGDLGLTGPKGAPGVAGPQGPQGLTGAPGTPGTPGTPGAPGAGISRSQVYPVDVPVNVAVSSTNDAFASCLDANDILLSGSCDVANTKTQLTTQRAENFGILAAPMVWHCTATNTGIGPSMITAHAICLIVP